MQVQFVSNLSHVQFVHEYFKRCLFGH